MAGINIDWKSIAGPLIGAGATVIGTAVGGPAGGVIGKTVGSVLSGALGVPETPEAVADAIAADPDAAKAALANSEAEIAKALAEANARMLETVNATYRVELQSEDWIVKYWRPVCGWGLALVWTLHGLAIGKAIWFKEYEVIKSIADLIVFYTVMGGVTGAAVWGRTKEKVAGVAGPAALETLAGAAGAVLRKAVRK